MSRYLMKYKGQYRIKPNLDLELHDFPRDENGSIDSSYDDIYIKCSYGSQIYHYGHSTLVAYIPSLGRGHNILIALAKDLKLINEEDNSRDYKSLYQTLNENKTVFDIVETDEEIEFKFNAKNIELIAKYLKPLTSGSDISPFSSRNLKKRNDVIIPEEDLNKYKKIINALDKNDLFIVRKITINFLENILQKECKKLNKDFCYKTDMKKQMLSRQAKEYIWTKNLWDSYLNYLKNEIEKYTKG